jgi:hypothetical protein
VPGTHAADDDVVSPDESGGQLTHVRPGASRDRLPELLDHEDDGQDGGSGHEHSLGPG